MFFGNTLQNHHHAFYQRVRTVETRHWHVSTRARTYNARPKNEYNWKSL